MTGIEKVGFIADILVLAFFVVMVIACIVFIVQLYKDKIYEELVSENADLKEENAVEKKSKRNWIHSLRKQCRTALKS